MDEIEEFVRWAKKIRKSLSSIIDKVEEKVTLSDKDIEFIEKVYPLFEEEQV